MLLSRGRPALAAVVCAALVLPDAPVLAAPLGPATGGAAVASQLDSAFPATNIRYRSRRAGAAVAAGIAGAIIGGIIASQARRNYPYYGYYDYDAYPYYRPYPAYDAGIAYCMRRFRSYDPGSMTYLGYDGLRHPCP